MDNRTFDSEFCSVKTIESDNIVLIAWKKFACGDDYRKPTFFALELLKEHPGSNLIVDARNGFEDEKADAEWAMHELLPKMAATSCEFVGFIMAKTSEIEEEMDLWTREFGKYFAMIRAESYEDALSGMKNLLLVNVKYTVRPGKREEFLQKVTEAGIIRDSKAEPGNAGYEYSLPIGAEDELFLMEKWVNAAAQAAHGKSEHYAKLQALKQEYVTKVEIEKFKIEKI